MIMMTRCEAKLRHLFSGKVTTWVILTVLLSVGAVISSVMRLIEGKDVVSTAFTLLVGLFWTLVFVGKALQSMDAQSTENSSAKDEVTE